MAVVMHVSDDGKITIGVEYRRAANSATASTVVIEDPADALTIHHKLPSLVEEARARQANKKKDEIAALKKRLRELEGDK